MKLQERLEIIQKIRKKYKNAADKYGKKNFDINFLEQRITHLFNTKSNFEKFIQQEYEFFKKSKNIIEAKIDEKRKKRRF